MRNRRPWRWWGGGAAIAVLLLCGGCGVGGNATLSSKSLDTGIAKQLKARYPAARVKVNCPNGVKETAGTGFSCAAMLDGQLVSLDGTVTSGRGRYSIQPAEAIVVSAKAAASLMQQISTQLHEDVTVDCGSAPFRVVPPGGQFGCAAVIPGQSPRQVTVTVQDTAGNMRFSFPTT